MRVRSGKEHRCRLRERYGFTDISRPKGRLIWFHAASIGEFVAAQPVILELQQLQNSPSILITTGTVTASEVVEERFESAVIHQFVPMDVSPAIDRFLSHWKPDLAVWMESELWPLTLANIKRNKIPALLINARMSQASFNRWSRFPRIIHFILSTFDACLAQSEVDRSNYAALGMVNTINAGNLKFAAGSLSVKKLELEKLKESVGSRKLWLFASTHRGEEVIATKIHSKLVRQFPDLLTVIIPRHPNRSNEIYNILLSNGMKTSIRSKGDPIKTDTAFYLADTIGEMGLFYRLGSIVCMGKSFIQPGGGQNPIEPAKLGCVVIFGPNMANFEEIAREMIKLEAAIQSVSSDGLSVQLERCMDDPSYAANLRQNALKYCLDMDHTIKTALKSIRDILHQLDGK